MTTEAQLLSFTSSGANFVWVEGGQAHQLPTQKEYCGEGVIFFYFFKQNTQDTPHNFTFSPILNDFTYFFFAKTVI